MVSLLDIIGPVMVGPSSSHTAGACRIGLFARGLLGVQPEKAKVELHGSFARTGVGHGTDRAIAGGLLGFQPDDERLRESIEHAEKAKLTIEFSNIKLRGDHHPNTTRITVEGKGDSAVLVGSSLGAGRILITSLNGFPVEITGGYPTVVFVAHDEPGVVAKVANIFAQEKDNIATMRVARRGRGGDAIHIYELDEAPSRAAVEAIRAMPAARMVRAIDRVS